MTTAHEGRRAAETHLSEDELATAADSPQELAAARARHLEDCVGCRDLLASVDGLRGALAGLTRPTLPADVAIRIDAALARESEARRTQTDSASTRTTTRRPRFSLGALTAWSLAGLAVLGGIVALAVVSTSGIQSSAGASSAAGSDSKGQGQVPALSPNAAGRSNAGTYSGVLALPSIAAPAGLAAWVTSEAPSGGYGRDRSGNLPTRASASVTPQVAACLTDPRFKAETLLKAELGTYTGAASVLAVYADGDDPGAVFAVAYAVPCTATRHSVLAEGVVPGLAGSASGG